MGGSAAAVVCPECGGTPEQTILVEAQPPVSSSDATADLTDAVQVGNQATHDLTDAVPTGHQGAAEATEIVDGMKAPAHLVTAVAMPPTRKDERIKPPHPFPSPPGGEGQGVRGGFEFTPGFDEPAPTKNSIPGYDILDELGRGGMGVVYKARQQGLNRLVALKMVLHGGHAGKQQLARFRLEAEAIAQLDHPYIVQIYDVGEHDGCPYFALEYVEGQNLASRINGTPQAPAEAARIVQQIAEAMAAAHQAGIIHRDLKPANILLTAAGLPKVTDFGLAKRFEDVSDDGNTRSGAVIGTPSYMAPEQAAGRTKHAGPAADIYATGAILYDLLTGRPPFQGQTLMDTLQQVQTVEPVSPIRLQTKVPRDLDIICMKSLQKEPHKRYATAGDLADDLRRFLAGEPIRARPTPWWERTIKWTRRHPTAATLMAVSVLFVISVLTFGGLWLNTAREAAEEREKQQAKLAEIERDRAQEQARLRTIAENAKIEEALQRKRAEENFRYARSAVDEMLSRVGQEKLAHEPRMEKIRKELLEKALEFYDRFLLVKSNDPAVRWEAGRAQQRVADIQVMLGQHDVAERAYHKAQELFKKLVDEFPNKMEYRQDLGAGYNNLGNLFRDIGRNMDAEQAYRKALDLREKLVEAFPKEQSFRKELAGSYNNLGLVLQKLGQLRDAEPAFTRGQKILLQLTKELPNDPVSKQELARCRSNLGVLLASLHGAVEAEVNLTESARLLEQLARQSPRVADYRQELALSQNHLGDIWRDRDPARAEVAYRKALKLRQQLVDDFPTTPAYRQDLAASYSSLAVLLQATGKQDEADKAYAAALGLRKKIADDFPAVPDFRRNLATGITNHGILLHTHNRLKEAEAAYQEAQDLFAKLASKFPDVPDYQQELVGIYLNRATLLANLGQPAAAEKVCREALEMQTQLASRFAQVSYQQELARLHLNLGSLVRMNNDLPAAEKAFRDAVAAFTKLAEQYPGVPDHRHQLAVCWNNLGNVLRDLKLPKEAEPVWREAMAVFAKLQTDFPQTPIYRQELGRSSNELGIFLATTGRFKEADRAWQDAIQLQEKLVAESPEKPDYRQELARSLSNYGILLSQTERADEAVKCYTRAVALLEELEPKIPVAPSYSRDLITSHNNLSNLLAALDRPLDAEKSQLRALAVREKLVEAFPKIATFRIELGGAQHDIARRFLERDKPAAARPLLKKAGEHLQASITLNPQDAAAEELLYGIRLRHAELLAGQGEHQQAASGLHDAVAVIKQSKASDRPMSRWEYQRLAAVLARCAAAVDTDSKLPPDARKAEKQKYADEAISWLQKAVDAGYRDVNQLKTATDFEAIRTREDFQKLLAKLEARGVGF